jgi:hypothetical protein
MQDSDPDPHGYFDKGVEEAASYIADQQWKMKWVTLFLAFVATAYVVISGAPIPFLHPSAFLVLILAMSLWVNSSQIARVFIEAQQHKATHGGDWDPEHSRRVYHLMIWQFVMSVIATHWFLTILFLSTFGEPGPSPIQ